ncbi:MAG: hypothetical protein LBH41_02850 [Rickettsiales bacterium]|nr:hypothetical protein [Rickettsiales bacterium]
MTEQMGGKPVGNDLPYAFAEFSDIPIPERANMILDHTSIYGRGDDWVGKITYTVPYGVSGVFDFYISEMPRFGWDEITSVRGSSAAMSYVRGKRATMVQINPSSLDGTVVTLNVSPMPPNLKIANTEKDKIDRYGLNRLPPGVNAAAGVGPVSVGGVPVSNGPAAGASSLQSMTSPSKHEPGGLGLGEASNANYPSSSPGVGAPPPRY